MIASVVACGMVLRKLGSMPVYRSRVDWEQKIVDAIIEH